MFRRIAAIIRKEGNHIFRDPRSLAIIFLMPLMMVVLYGYALRMDIENIPIGVIDHDHTPDSREVVEAFSASKYFTVMAYPVDAAGVEQLFGERRIKAAIVIPQGFAADCQRPESAVIQILVDGSDPTYGNASINYTAAILLDVSTGGGKVLSQLPLDVRERFLFNEELKSANFIIPGIVAVILMMVSALLTSITIAREKETGTMEMMLVSPVRPQEIIAGKIVPYIVIAILDAVFILVFARLVFGVPLSGNLALLFALSILYLYCALAIGLLISSLVPTQQVAIMAALVATILPSIVLSGFIFPVFSMPLPIRVISHIVPARHYIEIIRGILLKSSGFGVLREHAILAGGAWHVLPDCRRGAIQCEGEEMSALRHLIRKEFIQIRRTRSIMAIAFGMTFIQLLVIGFAISGDVVRVPAAITDLDNSPWSRELVQKLTTTRYLDVSEQLTTSAPLMTMLERGDVIITVTIPKDFQRDMATGAGAQIGVLVDAQNVTTALTGAGYVRRIILSWAQERMISAPDISLADGLIELESRVWYNPELKSVYYMVPGILVLLVTIVTVVLTAMAIVRERETGTLEQLMVTPLSRAQLIMGKTIPFGIIGMVELMFALGLARLIYGIYIAGSLPLFLILSVLYIFTTIGMGIFISTVTHTQQQALFTAWFILIYCFIMSGFFLPLENMPRTAYYLTYINPLRYYLTIVRELFLKGSGLSVLWREALVLAGFAVTVNTAAILRFHKRL